MAIIKITEKEKVDIPQDDASLLITQKIDGQEKLRRTPLVAAVEKALPETEAFTDLIQDLNQKMTRYIIRLNQSVSTYSITDLDGNAVSFADLTTAVRDTSNYVVCVYGNSKLRPQYVSTSEIVFTGLNRDSTGADALRMIVRPTGVQYDVMALAKESEISRLETEIENAKPTDYDEYKAKVDNLEEEKANIDGYYTDMSVGLAENLISPDGVIDSEPYVYRTTAGSQSVTDGYAELRSIKGNTVVWNQMTANVNVSSDAGSIEKVGDNEYKVTFNEPSSRLVSRKFDAVDSTKITTCRKTTSTTFLYMPNLEQQSF